MYLIIQRRLQLFAIANRAENQINGGILPYAFHIHVHPPTLQNRLALF